MKLHIKSFAFTCAILWGAFLFFVTWWMIFTGGVTDDPTLIGRVYLGYTVSPIGSLIGLAWAVADGLIIGAFFAWLYNRFVGRYVEAK